MDWHFERTVPFVPPPESSLSFLYNYNNYTYSGMEASEVAVGETQQRLLSANDDEMNMNNNGNDYREKKKTKNTKIKLTSNQVESLEKSFQEEIKLDPDRKMKLSAELGLHPRQIAVWFQNRRTRWRTKQLEHSNDVLKQENQKLKEEVMELKEKLKEKDDFRMQTFGDEVVESPLEGFGEFEGYNPYPSSHNQHGTTSSIQQAAEGYIKSSFIVEDFDSVSLHQECYWP
ncbi:homeobox-leucine zipper protein ATHB-22-like [Vicia villosa]|uniref:homeobox-leucine zipper protein ATHB-22-like n=1 Tax=Vicia villosa TaxID=3911 RepID=UPI00273C9C01|nr:homeobox-leucine zipper protein ATHB-22-like [Vicia villosa]